jgi:hypothetical protein
MQVSGDQTVTGLLLPPCLFLIHKALNLNMLRICKGLGLITTTEAGPVLGRIINAIDHVIDMLLVCCND